MKALREELEALWDHGTFSLEWLLRGKSPICAKFVLKIKGGPARQIERYKVGYVARGLTQVKGVDFFETYSHVGSYATFWSLPACSERGSRNQAY